MRRRTLLVGSVAVVASAVPIGMFNDVGKLEVNYLDLGFGSITVFLPDLHLHTAGHYEEDLLKLINSLDPDVVILGGDLVDRLTSDLNFVEYFVASIEASEKFYVLGNHEYWSGYLNFVRRVLTNNGFKELIGSATSRYLGRIYGLDWRDDRRYPDLKAEGLVVVHDPDAAQKISGKCFILAGHTHGGIVINGQTLFSNSKYVRGYYRLGNGVELYVSRGLGQMIPIRLTSPPELLVIR